MGNVRKSRRQAPLLGLLVASVLAGACTDVSGLDVAWAEGPGEQQFELFELQTSVLVNRDIEGDRRLRELKSRGKRWLTYWSGSNTRFGEARGDDSLGVLRDSVRYTLSDVEDEEFDGAVLGTATVKVRLPKGAVVSTVERDRDVRRHPNRYDAWRLAVAHVQEVQYQSGGENRLIAARCVELGKEDGVYRVQVELLVLRAAADDR